MPDPFGQKIWLNVTIKQQKYPLIHICSETGVIGMNNLIPLRPSKINPYCNKLWKLKTQTVIY